MVRGFLGFVVAVGVWMTAFFAMTALVAFVWPAYAVHGRAWLETAVFTFEPPMAGVNVVCWVLAEVFAGWVAVAIARRREPAWAVAAVLALYLAVLHLYWYWPNFPWWYNVCVAGLAAPSVLLGARLAGNFVRPSTDAIR